MKIDIDFEDLVDAFEGSSGTNVYHIDTVAEKISISIKILKKLGTTLPNRALDGHNSVKELHQ